MLQSGSSGPSTFHFSLILSLCLIAIELTGTALGQKPSKVEIGKLGKAATAYVEVPGGSGTGFCVHPLGLFVTNEHVIRGAEKAEIKVVLDPSLASQRELKASVVRIDKETDLALLRVHGVDNLPSLKLGSIEGVAELTEVFAFGFPLGRLLSSNTKEYPAISINGGTVTALRYKGSELEFLQIDAAINFGNSGGPVLDTDGKVVGVVVSKAIGATGINQAIPVSLLQRFLKAPDMIIVAPDLNRQELEKPQVFQVRIASFVPNLPEPELKLILQAGDEEPREFPMQMRNGVWSATAAPVTRPVRAQVELSVRQRSGTLSGPTDDVVIKVANKPVRLSGIKKIEFKPVPKPDAAANPKPLVLLADGVSTLEGDVTGLEEIQIEFAGQKLKLDLPKVTEMTIQPVPELTYVTVTAVASVAGAEVARVEGRAAIRDGDQASRSAPPAVPRTAPDLADDKVVKRLPEGFRDVALGGGGRYLIFHLPRLKKLAIFDFNEARITKYIPLSEDNITFAASMNSVVIGLRDAGRLERWSLTTFEREKSAPPPFKDAIGDIVLGHASNGPMVMNYQFVDLKTFRALPMQNEKGEDKPLSTAPRAASADSTVFAGWKTNQSPDESTTFAVEGNVVKRYVEGGLMHVIPGPDGKTIYTAKGICSTTLKRGDKGDATFGYCLPAVHGDFFLAVTPASSGKAGFTLYMRGLEHAIAKLNNINHGLNFDGWDREAFGPWKRVFMVPDSKVIAVLPPTNDQVVLFKFDADAALEASGLDYLVVASQPPKEIAAGKTLTYRVKVKSSTPKLTYTLDAGPSGMQLSPEGTLTWTPDDSVKSDQDVILTIRSSDGMEVFQTFTLRITK